MTDRILDTGNPGDPPPPPPPPGSSTPPPQDPNGDGGGPGVGGTPAPPRRHHTQPKAQRQNIAAWKPEDRPGAYKAAVRASPVGQLAELNQRVGRVAAESTHWASPALVAGHAGGGGGRFDSFSPPRGFPGGLPLPQPKKLGRADPTIGASHPKLSIGPVVVKGHEVTGSLQAKIRATWSVGRGKTSVSLDARTRAVSVTRGPLTFTDAGDLRRLVRRLQSPAAAVRAVKNEHRTFHDRLSVDFVVGRRIYRAKTGSVDVTEHVSLERGKKTVEVDATATVKKNIPGHGRVNLTYSLDSDLTVDKEPKKKDRQRQRVPIYDNLPIDAAVTLLVGAALGIVILGRRVPAE